MFSKQEPLVRPDGPRGGIANPTLPTGTPGVKDERNGYTVGKPEVEQGESERYRNNLVYHSFPYRRREDLPRPTSLWTPNRTLGGVSGFQSFGPLWSRLWRSCPKETLGCGGNPGKSQKLPPGQPRSSSSPLRPRKRDPLRLPRQEPE